MSSQQNVGQISRFCDGSGDLSGCHVHGFDTLCGLACLENNFIRKRIRSVETNNEIGSSQIQNALVYNLKCNG